ncbi:MAG TPA: hypothetical protein VMY42_13645 [Thermoguttaceae bacterium]|nr:hypothetical protein [Thermoguttaceae bacterium]
MRNLNKISKMQTTPFLVAAMLLLPPGRAAVAEEGGWTALGVDDDFSVWQRPTGVGYVPRQVPRSRRRRI